MFGSGDENRTRVLSLGSSVHPTSLPRFALLKQKVSARSFRPLQRCHRAGETPKPERTQRDIELAGARGYVRARVALFFTGDLFERSTRRLG